MTLLHQDAIRVLGQNDYGGADCHELQGVDFVADQDILREANNAKCCERLESRCQDSVITGDFSLLSVAERFSVRVINPLRGAY